VDGTPADSIDVLYTALGGDAAQLTLGLVRGTDELDVLVRFDTR
jgi:hypothetical protein